MEAEGGQGREFSALPTRFCKQSPSKKITSIHYFFEHHAILPLLLFVYIFGCISSHYGSWNLSFFVARGLLSSCVLWTPELVSLFAALAVGSWLISGREPACQCRRHEFNP